MPSCEHPHPNQALSDDDFLAKYEAFALSEFSHEDHLRMAYLYARRGGIPAAVSGARRIRLFAEALGAPEKYHDTLTVAWARVVGHFALSTPEASFAAFLEAHPQLLRRDLLGAHYSHDLLFSPAARSGFVEPDLLPLP